MNGPTPEARLENARMAVERSKQRLASTMGALQYRLKPGTLMSSAWEGVKEKSGEIADDTLQAVKERPAATSGVIAAFVLFLAREPLWRFISNRFSGAEEEQKKDIITAHLDHDQDYDLTAPVVKRSRREGVNA